MSKQLTNNEYDKKIENLIKSTKKHNTGFIDDTANKQRKRIDKAKSDLLFFAKTYFRHYIRSDFGEPHKLMHKETSKRGQITAIAGFRGLGKTTLLSIIKPMWLALKEEIHFNCKVAKSDDKAMERTAAIRADFMHNPSLKQDFGQQVKSNSSMSDFVIKAGCRFLALGYKTGIRGITNGPYRPDYIDIDDLEDHLAFNERIAKEKLQFVTGEAYGALDKGDGFVIWLGNLTHQKSALNLFKKSTESKKYPGRKMIIIKADDGNFNPTWPEKYTREDLIKMFQAMGSFDYERHMRMNPILEGLKFKSAWFKYYEPEDLRSVIFDKIVTYTDPSLGEKSTSDYKASITIGIDDGIYYLLECRIRRESILSMLRWMYIVHKKYNSLLFMEQNFWQRVLWAFIPPLAKKYGYTLPVRGVENKINKNLRIEGTSPLYEWGRILFPKEKTEDILLLIDQTLGWPDYPNDDGPDAVAGAIKQIEEGSEEIEYESVESTLANQFADLW